MKKKTATETMMEEVEKLRKKYLDSFDERLSEIEHQLNIRGMGGAADPHWCFVCGKPADMGFGNALGPQRGYCRKHMPETSIIHGPKCGCRDCKKIQSSPDLPLHARVAKALGKEVALVSGNIYKMLNMDWPKTIFPWIDIPAYDTDLVAAMGALEEYCSGKYIYAKVNIFGNKMANVRININHKDNGEIIHCSNDQCGSLSQAICEAIVAHAEQQ